MAFSDVEMRLTRGAYSDLWAVTMNSRGEGIQYKNGRNFHFNVRNRDEYKSEQFLFQL